jgi:hypothetical protein
LVRPHGGATKRQIVNGAVGAGEGTAAAFTRWRPGRSARVKED